MDNKLFEWGSEPKENDKGKFIAVKVKNAKEVYDWYINQGIEVIPEDELHCTIAYSKKDFEYTLSKEDIYIPESSSKLEKLGDAGAIVLKIYSQELQDRFNRCINAGATYDYPSYKPHITISYSEVDNLENIKQPDFDIILGDEYTNELEEDWKKKLEEKMEDK